MRFFILGHSLQGSNFNTMLIFDDCYYRTSCAPSSGCQTGRINGKLEEYVFLELPDGFVDDGKQDVACKLLERYMASDKHPNHFEQNWHVSLGAGFLTLL